MPLGGHVEWDGINWTPGGYTVVGYDTGSSVVKASIVRNTTGAAAALRVSVKDGMPGPDGMIAGCTDVGLVQVEVIDSQGLVVPTANNSVTFSIVGPATLGGTGNGDPADHTNDKSPTRPAYHGLLLAVILGGDEVGSKLRCFASPHAPPHTPLAPFSFMTHCTPDTITLFFQASRLPPTPLASPLPPSPSLRLRHPQASPPSGVTPTPPSKMRTQGLGQEKKAIVLHTQEIYI